MQPTPLDDTRRRFMTHFAGIGLGATLAPGVLWARMQDQGAQRITLEMVTDALKLAGIEATEAERQAMVNGANQSLARYEAIRALDIPNDVSPPFHFSAVVPGIDVDKTKKPFRLSPSPSVRRPTNLEEVAFWPVRHLAELVKSKKVTSSELTEMYLARLHRYNDALNNVVTFLDDIARAQAKQADAEIAAGKYRGPLHGIPWGAKDIISVKGYKTTWGTAPLKDQVLDYDASVVEMLREAGAVLIAKLTTGELASGDNWFGGQTKSPWILPWDRADHLPAHRLRPRPDASRSPSAPRRADRSSARQHGAAWRACARRSGASAATASWRWRGRRTGSGPSAATPKIARSSCKRSQGPTDAT